MEKITHERGISRLSEQNPPIIQTESRLCIYKHQIEKTHKGKYQSKKNANLILTRKDEKAPEAIILGNQVQIAIEGSESFRGSPFFLGWLIGSVGTIYS